MTASCVTAALVLAMKAVPAGPVIVFTWDAGHPMYVEDCVKDGLRHYRIEGRGKLTVSSAGLAKFKRFQFKAFLQVPRGQAFFADVVAAWDVDLGEPVRTNPGAPKGRELFAQTVTIRQTAQPVTFARLQGLRLEPRWHLDHKGRVDEFSYDYGIRYITAGWSVTSKLK